MVSLNNIDQIVNSSGDTMQVAPISGGVISNYWYNRTTNELNTTSTSYQNVVSVDVHFMPDKNYYLQFLTPLYNNGTGGSDVCITVNGTLVAEHAHRGHNYAAMYMYGHVQYMLDHISDWTSNPNGNTYTVSGRACTYSGGTTTTHDNHTKAYSSIYVWELSK